MGYGLEKIKVIETASVAAGPMGGRFLADWGADVIHVEHTIRKDQTQRIQATNPRGNINYMAQNVNRNKRGIALNLSTDHGREIIYKMLTTADVLLSNFRPYELEKFKMEYDTLSKLNPRLICANLTGYGKNGPDKNAPAYGPVAGDSRGGMLQSLMLPGGIPPQLSGTLTDFICGLVLACGIMTALFTRGITGLGQEVDVSLFQSMVYAMSGDIANALATGQERGTVDRKDMARPLMSPYKTKDGRWLMIWLGGIGTYQVWPRFCHALGREDLIQDERFSSPAQITQNYSELYDILDEVFGSKTLEDWKPSLDEANVPWSPLQNFLEVTKDPQAKANDFFVPLKYPGGEIEVVANPIKFSRIPEIIRTPAPEVGQHTDQILTEYGYSAEDIAKFREEGAIS